MKNIKQIALILCIGLILVFNSCKQKSSSPHLKAIPDDASFVVVFENKKLISKGGLNNLMDFRFFDQIEFADEATKKLIEEFTNNPKSFGIDLDQSHLFGVTQEIGLFIAMTFKINKVSTFEANIKNLAKANNSDDINIVEKGAYKIANVDEVTFAWNNELLIAGVSSFSSMVSYDQFFNKPKNKSIVSLPDFVEFNNRKYDIGLWAPYDEVINVTEFFTDMKQLSLLKELSGINIHSYVNFDDGEMKMTYKMTPQSKITEFLSKYPIIGKGFDNTLLRAFPEKSYLIYKQSINIPAYIEMLTDFSEQMGNNSSFNRIFDNPEVMEIINGLGGDIILSIYGFAQGPLPIPLVGLAFNVNSEDDFNKLMKMIPKGMANRSGDHYVVSFGMMISVYFAFKDNKVYVTDDIEAINAFTGKGFDKSLNSTAVSKNLMHIYLNLDTDSYPENVQAMLQNEIGNYRFFGTESLKYTNLYRDITVTMDNNYETVISLKFKDSRQNSLKQLVKFLDEI